MRRLISLRFKINIYVWDVSTDAQRVSTINLLNRWNTASSRYHENDNGPIVGGSSRRQSDKIIRECIRTQKTTYNLAFSASSWTAYYCHSRNFQSRLRLSNLHFDSAKTRRHLLELYLIRQNIQHKHEPSQPQGVQPLPWLCRLVSFTASCWS